MKNLSEQSPLSHLSCVELQNLFDSFKAWSDSFSMAQKEILACEIARRIEAFFGSANEIATRYWSGQLEIPNAPVVPDYLLSPWGRRNPAP